MWVGVWARGGEEGKMVWVGVLKRTSKWGEDGVHGFAYFAFFIQLRDRCIIAGQDHGKLLLNSLRLSRS